jgi:hypothetical protein
VQAEDYYQLLGVNRHASRETLRQAFRTRMLDLHPDLHPNDSLACEHTRELVEAYQVLSDPKARKSYDVSLARPEIPTLDWSYAEDAESVSLARQAVMLMVAALAVVLLIWAIRSCLDNRMPGFRFQLTDLWTDTQPQHIALLVEPDLGHGLEWYQTVEYQLGNSSALVTRETTEVYASALQSAERHGDYACARFFRLSLGEIRRAQMMDVPLRAVTESGSGTNPPANVPSSGAKPRVESS